MAKPAGDRGTRTGGRTVVREEEDIITFTALHSVITVIQMCSDNCICVCVCACVRACVHSCDVCVCMQPPRQCVKQLGRY